MATPIIMPKVGISVELCTIAEWNVNVGDHVNEGDILFSYETDKTSLEEAASCSGTLLGRFYEVGEDVPCLTNVCVIGEEGEDWMQFDDREKKEEEAAPAPAAPVSAPAAPAASAADAAPVKAAPADGITRVSPRARTLAAKTGINPAFVTPTGAEGRVISKDIKVAADQKAAGTFAAAAQYQPIEGTGIGGRVTLADIRNMPAAIVEEAAAPAADAYTDEKLPKIRQSIASAMAKSMFTIPQLTHNSSFDATAIMALRKQLKASAEKLGLANITYNDMILYAVSRALKKPEFRALNAHVIDDKTVRYFDAVHLGVAIDTPRGLMVATIFNADSMSLNEIATEAKALANACKDGSINPDKLTGATFSISNLGSFGVESFSPIINPPQTGILGVDNIQDRIRVVDGEITAYPAMGLSLTYDHRVIDGAPASSFLVELKNILENISVMLCK